jgi:Fe-Mn family superoxide dismutase
MSTNRRRFLSTSISAAIAGSTTAWTSASWGADAPPLALPKLPWEAHALDPIISSNTVGFHYGKHHRGYFDNLNRLLPASGLTGLSLEALVKATADRADRVALFNNAAQAWNHSFYWNSLSPQGGGKPGAELGTRIDAAFGSLDELRKTVLANSAAQFGSGWVWLALDKASNKLIVVKTGNADTPIAGESVVPLAVIDVWEHAYYLDYQNRRADYASALFDKLLNWRFVEANLATA